VHLATRDLVGLFRANRCQKSLAEKNWLVQQTESKSKGLSMTMPRDVLYLESEIHCPGPEVRTADADEDHVSELLVLVEVGAPLLQLAELRPDKTSIFSSCAAQLHHPTKRHGLKLDVAVYMHDDGVHRP
jgi:hypothetical protein